MLVTPFPMVTDVKPVQPSKAYCSMLVTLFGMVIDVKPLQPLKASSPMLVTGKPSYVDGIVISVEVPV